MEQMQEQLPARRQSGQNLSASDGYVPDGGAAQAQLEALYAQAAQKSADNPRKRTRARTPPVVTREQVEGVLKVVKKAPTSKPRSRSGSRAAKRRIDFEAAAVDQAVSWLDQCTQHLIQTADAFKLKRSDYTVVSCSMRTVARWRRIKQLAESTKARNEPIAVALGRYAADLLFAPLAEFARFVWYGFIEPVVSSVTTTGVEMAASTLSNFLGQYFARWVLDFGLRYGDTYMESVLTRILPHVSDPYHQIVGWMVLHAPRVAVFFAAMTWFVMESSTYLKMSQMVDRVKKSDRGGYISQFLAFILGLVLMLLPAVSFGLTVAGSSLSGAAGYVGSAILAFLSTSVLAHGSHADAVYNAINSTVGESVANASASALNVLTSPATLFGVAYAQPIVEAASSIPKTVVTAGRALALLATALVGSVVGGATYLQGIVQNSVAYLVNTLPNMALVEALKLIAAEIDRVRVDRGRIA